ncbi:MAG TPA: hypothetical protein VHV55_19760 [Pirellulales bacterium]|jgi:hypothetical protein|nr:hypothetical protein [Pirellulales bacterium]
MSSVNISQIKSSLRQYILGRIAKHPPDEPVKFIEFGYEVCQGGLFCVFFDTRPDAGPDGTWTVRLEGNSIDMPEWPELSEQMGDDFGIELGETIKNLVIELRENGNFEALPKQDGCEFGIEEMNGIYGWPIWEDRRKENLA